jgi:hypothetical protein
MVLRFFAGGLTVGLRFRHFPMGFFLTTKTSSSESSSKLAFLTGRFFAGFFLTTKTSSLSSLCRLAFLTGRYFFGAAFFLPRFCVDFLAAFSHTLIFPSLINGTIWSE